MYDEMNYERFKKYIFSGVSPNFSYMVERMIEEVEQVVSEEDIKVFYPKNLFSESYEDFEMIILTNDNKILHSTFKDKEHIEITVTNQNRIKKIKITHPTKILENAKLEIYYEDEEKLELNSLFDSNEPWQEKFKNKIIAIFKELA